ncbi:flagellar export chaperone FliS [Vibrio sp. HA2012]|uniref:flagellar export chaperone FliS n=1 Tax=Vibrio sp. HA2012 TaxID=1971595 RepID=UPI000C2C9DA7|nr:flagellar export chaperone FliS [Vibrio sp. HA2012]PJC86428.1 flagellar export chaperone FliS [Vibrio sp. HA2012]
MLMHDSGYGSYQQTNLDAQAASATPHQLVLMLIDGLLDEMIRAKGHISANRLAEKGQSINKCMNILIGLDSALDIENGGEIAVNLHDLYEFVQTELFRSSVNNDISHIETSENIITTIREGWKGFSQHA